MVLFDIDVPSEGRSKATPAVIGLFGGQTRRRRHAAA
jgi:hypothetical protein